MPRHFLRLGASWLFILALMAYPCLAGDMFSGDYAGQKLTLKLVAEGDSYTGSLHLGDKVFPVKAKAADGKLAGTFSSDGHEFTFTASLAGDSLTLTSGAGTYQLTRNPVNPLDKPQPVNPLNPAPNPLEAPASPDAPARWRRRSAAPARRTSD